MKKVDLEKLYEKWEGATITLNENGFPYYSLPSFEGKGMRVVNLPFAREILQVLLLLEDEPIIISKI